MTLDEGQRGMRMAYRRGSVGQLVAGLVWLGSAALGTGVDKRLGIVALVLGGAAIVPLTQLVRR